ncbi:MAG: MFS transporter [Bacillaceae bacterium]
MLKQKNVWILLLGEGVSGIGLWLGILGNLEFLQQHVQSDFLKSLVLFSGLFIGVLISPYAGKVIDRNKKKDVLIYASILRLVSILFMFLAIWFESVLFMTANMALIGIFSSFYFPALQATVPMIGKQDQLLQLNSLHMNVSTISRIIGTAVGGILLLHLSLFSIYFYSFIAYSFLLITTFFYDLKEQVTPKLTNTKSRSFGAIIPLLKEKPILLFGLLVVIIPNMFIGSFNLMVLKISEITELVSIKGWLYTMEGVSFLLGALIIKKLNVEKKPLPYLMIFSGAISFAYLSLYFVTKGSYISLFSFGLFGFCAGAFFPTIATLFQTIVPKEFHGRFFSFRGMLERIFFQVVLLLTGAFFDMIGFHWTVASFGIFSLLIIGSVLYLKKNEQRYFTTHSQKMTI